MQITLHLDGRTLSALALILTVLSLSATAYAGHGGDHHTRTSVDTLELEPGTNTYNITLSNSFSGKGWIPLVQFRNQERIDLVKYTVLDDETVQVKVRAYGNYTRKLYTVGVKE